MTVDRQFMHGEGIGDPQLFDMVDKLRPLCIFQAKGKEIGALGRDQGAILAHTTSIAAHG